MTPRALCATVGCAEARLKAERGSAEWLTPLPHALLRRAAERDSGRKPYAATSAAAMAVKTRPCGPRSTRIVCPGRNSPASSLSASGS